MFFLFLFPIFSSCCPRSFFCLTFIFPFKFLPSFTSKIETLAYDGPYNGAATKEAQQERKFIAQMLTSAVLLAAKTQEDDLFKTSVQQLRALYNDYPDCSTTETKCQVMGLNLLRLLADDQLASFHCELELLSAEELCSAPVAFATTLAQSLSEGSYHRVVSAQAPSAPFAAFMPKLNEAVRVDIANCSEKAYESLSVKDAQSLLFFNTESELSNFIESTEREWEMRDGRVWFAASGSQQVRVPSKQLIHSSLSYANELERIV